MDFKLHNNNGTVIAELVEGSFTINNTDDALDLMANANSRGAAAQIISRKDINDDFFDLSTGLAGEILQKYSNYRNQLGIIGNFTDSGKSLADFIYECNAYGQIIFMENLEEVLKKLSS